MNNREPKNTAEVSVDTKAGEERVLKKAVYDPYPELYTAGGPHAYVEMNVSKGFDFGNLRVTSRVSLVCNQATEVLDRAGVLAFEKAYAFARDGFEILMDEAQREKGT